MGFLAGSAHLTFAKQMRKLFQMLHRVGQREVTFAPETTEDLRPLLGKAYITDEKLHELASYAGK